MLAALLIPALLATGAVQGREEQVLRQFAASTAAYAALHREAAALLEPAPRCAGAEQLELTQHELAGEIRRLRAAAREGAIFTPEVAALLRLRLERAIRDSEIEAAELWAWPDERPSRWTADINEPLPPRLGPPRWQALFWALPPLPEELEYRFVDGDLVLLDPTANLVVDVLRRAVR